MLKNLVKDLKPSSTLLINETSRKLEEQGKKIYKFGFGQSPFKVPEDVVEELKNNSHQNKYLPMQGLLELRNAVAKYTSKKKNFDYKSENVIIGPGSKELMFLLHIIFDGEIILPAPSWVSYAPQAILGRNKIQILQTKRENNWFPTAAEIEKVILKNKNKNYLLFLNSPNNPSGQICENLGEISEIANKYNLIILSDEIYSELTFEDSFKSISNFCPEKTIISTGLSKWCGAGGWRLGYFLIPDNLLDIKNMINVLASETFSAVSAPIQYAAIKAYENDHSNYINKSKNILSAVGNYVYENLKSNKILINKPQGGFYLMPEFLNKKFKSSSEMCDSILNDTGVALLPGSDFGFDETKMLARLSFTDFDGQEFMNKIEDNQKIENDHIANLAPKIIEGVDKLKKWSESI
ncbi:aminotransferase class I/II-fold pyridoxal phosphate-dependent enzyme [Candidatus Pelagibacter sp.]|jgi:aspartate aminotransferase|nr:aminotransferase class I/II-fold pyridoxal phosphate-dependent enzyme [Candidatus Pelagibacter sp.]MDC0030350.1 aminotransferase class I/II-fold pyridoxal phosphate-dependent enzyme [Candidatus Pelagibacter sp.]MDC0408078.1 aminotransferase class I/II-fold pyridoxal phosphate-dependent enzyme [Candidatus Pelagibacter sp.]MDC0960982.1 aminotransferase class I/II-fold pyridoxal phosphate-dependent enzyme [Candidatus Pelagibacter sp.]